MGADPYEQDRQKLLDQNFAAERVGVGGFQFSNLRQITRKFPHQRVVLL